MSLVKSDESIVSESADPRVRGEISSELLRSGRLRVRSPVSVFWAQKWTDEWEEPAEPAGVQVWEVRCGAMGEGGAERRAQ